MKNITRVAIVSALLCLASPAFADFIGDYRVGDTIDCKFGTVRPSTGASFTLGGTPAVSVYKDNSTTESTSGVTLSADFDSRTGLANVRVTTASDGTFYSAGSIFYVVITTGTVDSVSVVGQPVCAFTLEKTSHLRPTTAGRTLDVSSGGEAGVDWANIGSPTSTVNLSGTTVKTATDVETDTADIQTRLPAALVSGRIDASVGAYQTGLTPLQPTTAGRTLDVTTTGEAGIDWANIGSPTTAQTLSGTTIGTATTLTNAPSDSSGTTTLLSRLSSTRAGYLDNLSAGAVAQASALSTLDGKVGTVSNLGGGATLAANLADIEAQTDDIGTAGAGLTAADDAVLTRLGTPAGASVSADLAAIEDQTDEIGAAGAGLTAVPWNAAWDAEAQSEADDALKALYLDRLFATDYDPASKPGTSTALLNELVESDAGVSRFTANALEQGPAGGGGGTSDWTTGEKEQIRNRLGIDGDAAAPTATPTLATAAALSSVASTVGTTSTDVGTVLTRLTSTRAGYLDNLSAGAVAQASALTTLTSRVGTPSDLGGGATVAGNLADIEAQTDDIGAAGAGLTAADDAVLTRLGTPAGASVSADLAAIEDQTDDIGVAGAGLTAAGMTAAQMRSALGLTSNNLDAQLAALATDLDSVAVSVEAVPADVGSLVIESEGGGFTLQCVLRALLAYNVGDAVTTDNASTFKAPGGTTTRVEGTAPSPGNRTVTVTCP